MTDYKIAVERYEEIVQKIAKRKILIIGDVGVDRYTVGEASRLSPEAPVPIVAVDEVKDKLGLAANVGDNIKALGGTPILATLIGKDRNSEELQQLLRENEISNELIFPYETRRTTLKERVMAMGQQVVRIDHEHSLDLSQQEEDFFWQSIEARFSDFDGIIIEDYAKGLITESLSRKIIQKARELKMFVSVDPPSTSHPRHINYYRNCSMITPNLAEAERLSGIEIVDEKTLHQAGSKLMEELDAELVIITQGKTGMTLFPKGKSAFLVPTFASAVSDVSGAGDTVIAMQTLAYLSGANLRESALLANFAAGCVVGKVGTATVDTKELRKYINSIGGFAQV